MWNKIMDVGGPDEGMTMKEQGDMMFEVLMFCYFVSSILIN